MRCKNCGWPNKPSESTCVKCGSPLDAEQPLMEPETGYQVQNIGDNDGLTKTVMETQVFGGYDNTLQRELTVPSAGENVCPKCRYPLRPGVEKCPNCNHVIGGAAPTMENGNGGYQRQPTRMAAANPSPADAPTPTRMLNAGNRVLRGTINPYMMNYQAEPAFTLQPLQRMNERKIPEAVELEGSEVILNRENTEPDNGSITSREQAIVTHTDGHWYIENRSEQQTTFVQATKKIELHDGDIILLGNRLFKFQEQK